MSWHELPTNPYSVGPLDTASENSTSADMIGNVSQNHWLIPIAPTWSSDIGSSAGQVPTSAIYWGALYRKILDVVDRHDHGKMTHPEYSVWARRYGGVGPTGTPVAQEYYKTGIYYFGKQLSLSSSFFMDGEPWDLVPVVHNKLVNSGVSFGIDSNVNQYNGGVAIFTFHPQQVDEILNFSLFPEDNSYGMGNTVVDRRRTLYCRMGYSKRQNDRWTNAADGSDVQTYPSLDLVWNHGNYDTGNDSSHHSPIEIVQDRTSLYSGFRDVWDTTSQYYSQIYDSPDVGVFCTDGPFNFVTQSTTTAYYAAHTTADPRPSFISVDTSSTAQDVEFLSKENMNDRDQNGYSTDAFSTFSNFNDQIWMPGDIVWVVDTANNASTNNISVKDNSTFTTPGIFRYYDSTSALQSVNTITMNVNSARILLINHKGDYAGGSSGGEWFGYMANF